MAACIHPTRSYSKRVGTCWAYVVEKNSTTPLFKPTIVELKNKNLAIALDIDLVVSSNNDTEEDSSIDTTMDSDDDYDIEDSMDQVM
jgi:hypothetical protein